MLRELFEFFKGTEMPEGLKERRWRLCGAAGAKDVGEGARNPLAE